MITRSVKMAAVVELFGVLLMLSASSLAMEVGEFTILHAPKSVHFLRTENAIDSSEIPAVVALYLGLPLNSDIKWDGLAEGSPFQRPKAAVVISIDSLPNGKLELPYSYQYKMLETGGEFDSESTINYIQSLDWKKVPVFVDFSAEASTVELKSHRADLFSSLPTTLGRIYEDAITHKKWFKTAHLGSLNVTNDADLQFVAEVYMISEIVDVLKRHPKVLQNHSPDFYHFRVNGLEALVDAYGRQSEQVKDAVHLLNAAIEEVANDFREMYHDNCVIQVAGFQQPAVVTKTRKGRSLLDAEVNTNKTLNLAPEFTDMYPVIFNIILWTMIAMGLAIFAISWGIWHMDPGRDSLIYRMTSQRKKND
jgi:renin receptor